VPDPVAGFQRRYALHRLPKQIIVIFIIFV
jgi:hypothetical protein